MSSEARILIVEDEPDLNRMLSDFLTSRGYLCESAFDGTSALAAFYREVPDLVILDLNLPHIDGMEVARTIRTAHNTPIIMLTARGEEEDTLAGFEVGTDDYVVKPASMKEIAARVTALLKRSSGGRGTATIARGTLLLDTEKRRVYRDGTPLNLTGAQFAILQTLMSSPGRVFTRMQLLETFQDHAFAGYERTVDVHIKNIRKALGENQSDTRYIETVWGTGYRFTERELP